jgi:hypothetical protein
MARSSRRRRRPPRTRAMARSSRRRRRPPRTQAMARSSRRRRRPPRTQAMARSSRRRRRPPLARTQAMARSSRRRRPPLARTQAMAPPVVKPLFRPLVRRRTTNFERSMIHLGGGLGVRPPADRRRAESGISVGPRTRQSLSQFPGHHEDPPNRARAPITGPRPGADQDSRRGRIPSPGHGRPGLG